MRHPLETLMAEADGFVVIGTSGDGHFPATSFATYTGAGKRFYCVDLDGLTQSRGPVKGERVYPSVDELPDDHGDLAILWTHPHQATRAVDAAHAAGCTKVWFSFFTGHRDAVAHARSLGMEVVEIGRCPVYFLDAPGLPVGCRVHTAMVRVSGTRAKPPQLDAEAKRRELW